VNQPLQIAIVGYGIGGIAAAVHLRRLGHFITHFDRHDPPSSLGAGMLLHPPAQRELHDLGILEEALACGARVRHICAQTTRGSPLYDLGYADLAAHQFGLGIQRGTLHRLLSSADTGRDVVRGGHIITDADPHGGYLLQDSGRRHGPYDLIVFADGAESALRAHASFTERRNLRATTAALVGLLDDHDNFASDRLVQNFDRGAHISVWPVGRDLSGGPPRCSFAMNIAIADADACRDRGTWKNRMTSLCPGLERVLKGQGETPRPYVFTYRDVEVSMYSSGRTVLIGDAAHSMSPQLGIGAQLAMADARILANNLAVHSTVAAALNAYSRTRPLQLNRYQRASRCLTPLLQSENQLLAGFRDRVFATAMRSPIAKWVAQDLFC
jgi:2-polyprenyl-6-methoxyphenol hydroxylase-like FAD-dependent oxidoreductase